MEPTLRPGDILSADKVKGFCGHTHPKPGQIIVFRHRGVPWVSRVIAGPGHTVEVRSGRLIVDGNAVAVSPAGSAPAEIGVPASLFRETLANGKSYLTMDLGPDGLLDNTPVIRVRSGWFVMGDNRDNAADSRINGTVDERDICGVAINILAAKDKSRVGQGL